MAYKKNKEDLTETASSAMNGALFKEDIPRPKRINTADVWMNKKIDPKDEKGLGLETSATEDDTLMGRLAKRMASRDFIDRQNLGMGTAASRAERADTSPEEMQVGKEIEYEHNETVEKINPKFNKEKAAKMIRDDHLKEHNDYYDNKKGLPEMERRLESQDDVPRMMSTAKLPLGLGRHQHNTSNDFSASDPLPTEKSRDGRNMMEQAKNAGNIINTKHHIKEVPKK